jgi:hypothetical protein
MIRFSPVGDKEKFAKKILAAQPVWRKFLQKFGVVLQIINSQVSNS